MSYADKIQETQDASSEDDKRIKNWGGGYSYEIDKWDRLERFLVLGSDDGNYYTDDRELTLDNAEALEACLDEDPERAVEMIRRFSVKRRCISNNTAIFALAVALQHGDEDARRYASGGVLDVCRTGSHILRFVSEVDKLGGWATIQRRAVSRWYTDKDVDELAYQMTKYQRRNGWTHQDVMRMAHPDFNRNEEPARDVLFDWVCGECVDLHRYPELERPRIKEKINAIQSPDRAAELVRAGEIPSTAVPGRLKSNKEVWEALLYAGSGMPIWALVRNLGKMTAEGVFDDHENREYARDILMNQKVIDESGIHPIKFLEGYITYKSGSGYRGSLTWDPKESLVGALKDGFFMAFSNVEPTGDRFLLGVDVSGSMTTTVTGHQIQAMQGAAAMAMIRDRCEEDVQSFAFSAESYGETGFKRLPLDGDFDELYRRMKQMSFGATDCALPMRYAIDNNLEIDTFIVYTDHETNVRREHPQDAIERYREASGIRAKLVTVALQPNKFSIADPDDPLTMDVVGWDTYLPRIINRFVTGLQNSD